jgi:hypothetical protein
MQYNDKAHPPLLLEESIFRFEALKRFGNLIHGVSCRRAPDLGVEEEFSLGVGASVGDGAAGRRIARFCDALGISPGDVAWFDPSTPGPVKKATRAHTEMNPNGGVQFNATSALFTKDVGVFLAVLINDDPVVMMFDPRRYTSALIGIRNETRDPSPIFETIDLFLQEGSRKRDVMAAITPSLGPCCYQFPDPALKGAHNRSNMWDIVRGALTTAGLKRDRIFNPCVCTKCNCFEFYSRTADGPRAGANAAVIGALNRGNFEEVLERRREGSAAPRAFAPPAAKVDGSLTEEEKRLNDAMRCPYGRNKVYIRSLLTGTSQTSAPEICLRCKIIAHVKLAPEGHNVVDKAYIEEYCCGHYEACPAYRKYRAELDAKERRGER